MNKRIFLFLIYVYECLAYMCVWVPCACLYPTETRRGYWILCNYYRMLWATFWVLGIQPRFSLNKTFLSPGRFLRSFRSSLYQEYGGNDKIFYFVTLYKVNKLCFIIFKFFWCVQFCCILKEKTIHCIACIWLVEIPENNFRETFNCVH